MFETKKQHDARVQRIELRFVRIVEVNEHRRSRDDQRRFVVWTLCEYRDVNNGDEYRVAFETRLTEAPVIPQRGMLREINLQRKQW